MKKRIVAMIMCGILGMSAPVMAEMFSDKEVREDGTFDGITAEEVIEYAGLQKMEWSDDWKPIVGMLVGEDKTGLISLFEPDNNTYLEELYVYISPHKGIDTKALQDLFIGNVTYDDRKKATTADETHISTDKCDAMFYSYVIENDGYFNVSMNTGTAILDFVYQYHMGMEHPNMDSFLAMCDTIEIKQ